MGFGDKVLFFFSALGAFNGLILSMYFFFFAAKKHLSNYFLGALLLVLSIRIGKSVAYFFDYGLPRTFLQIGLTACFFIGPFLYFFIRSEIHQVKKLPGSWTWQILTWLFIILGVGAVYPYEKLSQIMGKLFRTADLPAMGCLYRFLYFVIEASAEKDRSERKFETI